MADARTAQPNAQGAIASSINHVSSGGVTSYTAIPNEIFVSTVEQANPIVVHAETEASQPMGTEIPMETVENNEVIPRREINSAEADRIVNAMIEEQKQQPFGAGKKK